MNRSKFIPSKEISLNHVNVEVFGLSANQRLMLSDFASSKKENIEILCWVIANCTDEFAGKSVDEILESLTEQQVQDLAEACYDLSGLGKKKRESSDGES